MKFGELALKLEPYFDKELILDVKRQLPQGSDYSIWSWDVGDYSGDGFFDVAFAVKLAADRNKIINVYFFVDLDGFLTKVGQMQVEYYELPLEIGLAIKQNTCSVIKKRKQFDWSIKGYTFRNGSLISLEEFTTNSIGKLTRETYHNYQTLKNSDKYLTTTNGKEVFSATYLTIPSYQRGRRIYKGFQGETYCNYIDYVTKGAFYWTGDYDLSFSVSSAYDNNFIYMSIEVMDDKVVPQKNDSSICDHIEVWFDMTPSDDTGNRFMYFQEDKIHFRTEADSGIYSLTIYPGNFEDKLSYVKVSTTDDLDPYIKQAAKNIKSVSVLRDSGYVVKFKVPFSLFGYKEAPIEKNKPFEIGCTIIVHDIDNQYRPEEETIISTSKFSSLNPATYGNLILIPVEKSYGEAYNIYTDDILKHLMECGF
ncbi:MAG: Carb-bd dom fam9 protein [Ignavibacteria bacterium]|nr:Carb-bd dom fam9 protein [Ignavibacteria bacterium]